MILLAAAEKLICKPDKHAVLLQAAHTPVRTMHGQCAAVPCAKRHAPCTLRALAK